MFKIRSKPLFGRLGAGNIAAESCVIFVCDNFLCDVSLYCGGLDRAGSRMTTLVAFIFAKRFRGDFSKTVKLRFLYGLQYQGLYFVRILPST